MISVCVVQEQILKVSMMISQLMLRAHWLGTGAHADTVSSIFDNVIQTWSLMGLSAVEVLNAKLDLAFRVPPDQSMHLLLFKDIDKKNMPKNSRFDQDIDTLLKLSRDAFSSDFLNIIQRAIAVKAWPTEKCTDQSIYLSLLSAMGDAASALQFISPDIHINDTTESQKDCLTHGLADVTIFLMQFCHKNDIKVVFTPLVCANRSTFCDSGFILGLTKTHKRRMDPSLLELLKPNK
jgi:hypothetical protein